MRTILLDTCIWSYWFNPGKDIKKREFIERHVGQLPALARLGISVITWGEIAYGHRLESPKQQAVQNEYLQFIKTKGPKTFAIDMHTANKYGELRALLFEKYLPGKRKPGLRPEQLIDPVTSLELGIQENDLWIAAQAMARNLTLVTNDKLSRIREVAGDELHIENWMA